MKPIKIDLSENFKEIEIMPIADWHWSDPNSDHDKIMSDIAYINDHDNVFAVLHGDLLDCAIASSVGDTYGALLSPMEELRVCVDLFKPLAEKGKILTLLKGNHEHRHYKTNGIDVTALMAQQLGLAHRYSPTTSYLFIRFGQLGSNQHNRKVLYTMYVTHGNSGGRKEGAKIQRLVDYSTICDADIYLCGHTHLPAILKERFARPSFQNSSITYGTRLYINTSAKLEYGGYGDTGGYKVPCTDTPIIMLSGDRKEMRALL